MTLATIERTTAESALQRCNTDSTVDDLAAAINAVQYELEQAKERAKRLDDLLLGIAETRGEFVIGNTLYRATGPQTERKCRDLEGGVEDLFIKTQGDLKAFCAHLSANALKPGACRTTMGEDFDKFFTTTTRVKLDRVENPTARQLAKIPTFLLEGSK